MHKYFTFILLLFVPAYFKAQITISGSFDYEGITRSYSFYVPASYVPGEAVPLVLNLHGLGTDGTYQAQNRDFRPIADTANFIVAHPDGSIMLGQHFWNYGNVLGSTVDDVGFLEALVDTISAHYSINPNRVYSTGISNGGFMCYALACQSNRFAAIASVTGSMSVSMYNSCSPSYAIPTMHIHGTSDQINPYTGNSTMKGIEEVTSFWVNQNNCNPVPLITPVANSNTGDNASAERYLYSGGNGGHTVELFKVTGGGHTWPGTLVPSSNGNTCMDFSASTEIWRFFSQYERDETAAINSKTNGISVKIWPNPGNGLISIQAENAQINKISVFDLQGRLVGSYAGENILFLSLDHLSDGNYLLEISSKLFRQVEKIRITVSD